MLKVLLKLEHVLRWPSQCLRNCLYRAVLYFVCQSESLISEEGSLHTGTRQHEAATARSSASLRPCL
jgi:hypothetical protein